MPAKPKNTVHIPRNADEVHNMFRTRNEAIDALVTARNWVRALIVWAHCEPKPGTRTSLEKRVGGEHTFKEFADIGIVGLGHPETVARYYWAIDELIVAGTIPAPVRGENAVIPDLPWPGSGKDRSTDGPSPAAVAKRYNVAAKMLISCKAQLNAEEKAAVLEAAQEIVQAFGADGLAVAS